MESLVPRERRELVRTWVIDAGVGVLVLVPTAVVVGDAGADLDGIVFAALAAAVLATIDVMLTRNTWRRNGGFVLRLAIKDAITTGHLPDDADPDEWTRPLVERLRAAHSGSWQAGGAATALVVLTVLWGTQHRLQLLSLAVVGLAVALLLGLLVGAIRDRGSRADVMADLLAELDERAVHAAALPGPAPRGQ